MSRSLRIIVADDEREMREFFEEILQEMGHEVISAARNGQELLEQCRAHRPDLVITDIKMPVFGGIDAARKIGGEMAVPLILVSAYHEPELIARADVGHVMAYLIKPIKSADLIAAIAVAMRRSAELEAVKKEASDLRQALEDRKLIERAKGVLMRMAHLDENDAFLRLQDIASKSNQKMVTVARMILTAEETLMPKRPR